MDSEPGVDHTTEYNMTFTLFFRVNSLFYRADAESMTLNIYGWYHTILAVYREIAPLIKETDRAGYETTMTELLPEFIVIKQKLDAGLTYNLDFELYKRLMNFEIRLRDVMNKAGMYIQQKKDRSFGVV